MLPLDWFSLCVFAAVTLLTLGALSWSTRTDPRLTDRMNELSRAGLGANRSTPAVAAPAAIAGSQRLAAALLPNDFDKLSQLQTQLMLAGIYSPAAPSIYCAVRACLAAAGALIGVAAIITEAVAFIPGLLLTAAGGCLGMILPSLWLDGRRRSRLLGLTRSLPDFLDLMVTCLESGLSLDGALQRVTAELTVAHPELAAEMARAQREIELGATADDALKNLAHRTGLDSARSLGTLVQQARRFGTSIGDALRVHAESLREQREQRAEEIAQKAAVKILFPTLLFIFPAVFVILAGPAAIQLHEKFSAEKSEKAGATSSR